MARPVLLLDFDSTLVRFETLDALADLSLDGHPESVERRARIAELTAQAMAGQVAFDAALDERLVLADARRDHVQALADRAVHGLTPSIVRNRTFFDRAEPGDVWIVSGGLRDVIAPVAEHLGIPGRQVLCNDLVYDAHRAVGVDPDNPLARDGGKIAAVRALGLERETVMVGDGWSDWRVMQAAACTRFHAFTEIVRRAPVVRAAGGEARSFDAVLQAEGLTTTAPGCAEIDTGHSEVSGSPSRLT